MKPPTAMLIPLLMWDIASSMGTTLFFGTVRSFARKRPALEAHARARAPAGQLRVTGRVSPGGRSLAGRAWTSWPASRTLPAVSPYGQHVRDGGCRRRPLCASSSTVYFARRNAKRRAVVTAVTESASVGVIGGSGFYELLENAREVVIDTPFGAAVGLVLPRRDRRRERRLPAASRARAPHPARRGQLPRQHLGHEGAGGALRALRQRRRQPPRGAQAARRRRAGPALRPHQGAAEHVLRRRRRRAHGLRRPVLPVHEQAHRRGRPRGRRHGARGRHLRLHRGSAVQHARREQRLPPARASTSSA